VTQFTGVSLAAVHSARTAASFINLNAKDKMYRHLISTQPGDCGSPLIDRGGSLIGVHAFGIPGQYNLALNFPKALVEFKSQGLNFC
jgi:V8-like Glu-specific endopeptidase